MSDSTSADPPVTPVVIDATDLVRRMQENRRVSEEEEARRRRLLNQPFELRVGNCACGGSVIFDFKGTVLALPFSEVRIGGYNPMKESYRLACNTCGMAFDREHPPIAQAIEKYREDLLK